MFHCHHHPPCFAHTYMYLICMDPLTVMCFIISYGHLSAWPAYLASHFQSYVHVSDPPHSAPPLSLSSGGFGHHLSTRRDQSVFNRCRIGHSRLTHEFLLKGEPPPECIPCNCPLTIKHLLIECVDFNDVRQRFYQVPTLQDLFKTVKPEVILDFLKAAALYRLL